MDEDVYSEVFVVWTAWLKCARGWNRSCIFVDNVENETGRNGTSSEIVNGIQRLNCMRGVRQCLNILFIHKSIRTKRPIVILHNTK